MSKKFFIIQWLGGDRYFVKKTYSGRVVISSKRIDARLFEKEKAERYLSKLQALDTTNEFQIRQLS